MDKIVIKGGKKLKGEVFISGAKNAALPILVSSLLTDGNNTYHNVPNLRDITSIIKLLEDLGATIKRDGTTVQIDSSGLAKYEASYDLVRKMRASILVLCPLVARLKRARVSLPGGCAIGARPINLHLKALTAMGAEIVLEHGYVDAKANRLKGCDIYFDIKTVTGTENILMAAVLAKGQTIIRNAACEPEITALADVLRQMGADIRGDGTSRIIVNGVKALKPITATIIPDRIEAGTFMASAALTGGEINIKNCNPEHLGSVINIFSQTGVSIKSEEDSLWVSGPDELVSVDVKTQPFPGFPTDMQAQFMVMMSVASGISMISESIFENRFIHVSELRRLGADIKVTGNSAMIKGVKNLSGAPVMATDLRASASLVLAGLIAKGKTEVKRVYHLDRGYEAIEKKLIKLGAEIKREKDVS